MFLYLCFCNSFCNSSVLQYVTKLLIVQLPISVFVNHDHQHVDNDHQAEIIVFFHLSKELDNLSQLFGRDIAISVFVTHSEQNLALCFGIFLIISSGKYSDNLLNLEFLATITGSQFEENINPLINISLILRMCFQEQFL